MKKLLLIYLLICCTFLPSTKIYAQAWKNLGPPNTYIVQEIAEINGNMYAVGNGLPGLLYPGVVSKYDGVNWTEMGAGFDDYSRVDAIAEFGGDIYIGGTFTMDNGTDAPFNYLARWDDGNSRWVPVANGTVSGEGVFELVVYGGELYAGGNFDDLGQAGNNNIAAYDGTSWSFVGSSAGVSSLALLNTATQQVTSMVEYDGKLIVGGKFDSVDGILMQNIASWNGTTWAYLKGDVTNGGGGIGGDEANNYTPYVKELVVYNNTLYIAGKITKLYNTNYLEANSTNVLQNLVTWDGVDFSNPAKQPASNTWLQGVTVFNTKIYFGAPNESNLLSWNGDTNFNWETEYVALSIWSLYSNATNLFRGAREVSKYSDPVSSFAASNSTPCIGASVSFTDLSTSSETITAWEWTFEGGTPSTSTIQSPAVTYSTAGIYDVTLKVTSATGVDITTSTDYIEVDETLTIDTQPLDITTCPGSVNFTVAATSIDMDQSYQWQLDSGLGTGFTDLAENTSFTKRILGTTTASLNYKAEFIESGFKFRCKITRCATELISSEVTLTVKDGPVVTDLTDYEQEICISGDASFSIESVGGANITYQWQIEASDIVDGGVYSGANTPTLTLTGVDENLPGLSVYRANISKRASFTCVVSSDNGCSVTSRTRIITLFTALPPVNSITITSQPADIVNTCAGGSSYRFDVTATNSATGYDTRYQWQVDDGNGFIDITSEMDGYGGETVRSLTISTSLIKSSSLYGYQYRCKVSASKCGDAAYSDAAVLEVDSKPVITEGPSGFEQKVCDEGTIEYTIVATGRDITYQWQVNNVNIVDGLIYSGATTDKLVVNASEMNSSTSKRYRCVITSGQCSVNSNGSGYLYVYEQPTLTATTNNSLLTVCDGGSTELRVNASNNNTSTPVYSYQWQVDFAGTGVFTDLVEDDYYSRTNTNRLSIDSAVFAFNGNAYRCIIKGCTTENASEPDTLTVLQLPLVTTSPESKTVCRGDQVTFTALATGSDLKYSWRRDKGDGGGFSQVQSARTDPNYTFTASDVTFNGYVYKCIVQAGNCTTSTAESFEATLTVQENRILDRSPSPSQICAGETIKFGVMMSNLDGLTFQWSDGNGELADDAIYSGVTNDTLTISAPTTAQNNYSVAITGACGNASASFNLSVAGLGTPEIVSDFGSPDVPRIFVSNSNIFQVGVDNFEWFLNGSTYQSTGNIGELNLTEEGSYTVVASKGNCIHPESEAVIIIITGFEDNLSAKEISFYPNPVNNKLTLEMGADFSVDKGAKIVISNVSGKEVYNKIYNALFSGQTEIDMSSYESGIYLVRVINGDKITQYKIRKL